MTGPARRPAATVLPVLARELLVIGAGGRLPTAMQLQERLGVGSGTVQRAIRELEWAGAIELNSRGHLGTRLVSSDEAALWSYAQLPPVHVLLPAYGARESSGVAFSLARWLDGFGARCTAGFQQGAGKRLGSVVGERADVAVMSSGARDQLRSAEPAPAGDLVVVDLGPNTYYAQGSLVLVSRPGGPGRHPRVAVDPHSSDHQRLTRAEFGGDADPRFVEVDFTTVPRAVAEGVVDTGIWHTVDALIPPELAGLAVDGLATAAARDLALEMSAAVLVARAGTPVGALLDRLDPAVLAAAPAAGRQPGSAPLPVLLEP